MKRPEGFDPPAQPQRPARGPAPRSSRPAAPRAGSTRPSVARPALPEPKPAPQPEAVRQKPEVRRREKVQRSEVRRFTRRSRRRRAAGFAAGAVVLALLAVLAVAVFSPILALRTIRVEGTKAVSASAVRASLDNELGTPLALLDDTTIAKDLSRFVLIRSYVTEIVPPNTLVVRVEERSAIGVIQDGDAYQQVDPAGVILATSQTPAGLPVIQIGSTRARGAGFAAAVKVLLAMPQSVFSQVKTISATTVDNVSLTLKTGSHTVLWGSSAQSALKAQDLAAMLGIRHCREEPTLNVTAPLVLGCGPALSTPKPTPTPTSTP